MDPKFQIHTKAFKFFFTLNNEKKFLLYRNVKGQDFKVIDLATKTTANFDVGDYLDFSSNEGLRFQKDSYTLSNKVLGSFHNRHFTLISLTSDGKIKEKVNFGLEKTNCIFIKKVRLFKGEVYVLCAKSIHRVSQGIRTKEIIIAGQPLAGAIVEDFYVTNKGYFVFLKRKTAHGALSVYIGKEWSVSLSKATFDDIAFDEASFVDSKFGNFVIEGKAKGKTDKHIYEVQDEFSWKIELVDTGMEVKSGKEKIYKTKYFIMKTEGSKLTAFVRGSKYPEIPHIEGRLGNDIIGLKIDYLARNLKGISLATTKQSHNPSLLDLSLESTTYQGSKLYCQQLLKPQNQKIGVIFDLKTLDKKFNFNVCFGEQCGVSSTSTTKIQKKLITGTEKDHKKASKTSPAAKHNEVSTYSITRVVIITILTSIALIAILNIVCKKIFRNNIKETEGIITGDIEMQGEDTIGTFDTDQSKIDKDSEGDYTGEVSLSDLREITDRL